MANHLVQFSGGVGSWAAAKRVAEKHGTDNLTLLFADVRMEDEDLYRFLPEAAADVGGRLVIISAGKTPWELFHEQGMIGNTRADLCSRILKRDLLRDYRDKHFSPDNTVVHFGIDWTERHRIDRLHSHPDHEAWTLSAPLCEPPYLNKQQLIEQLRFAGIEPPRLYKMGYAHNNCGGFCIKSGQAQFALLYRTQPERYLWHEAQEEVFREKTGKNVSVMRDRTDGETKPLTMRQFREERLEGDLFDRHDWGGCGCAL